MIGETIKGFFESRSIWDLLLILAGYWVNYVIYLYVGIRVIKVIPHQGEPFKSALFLGVMTLLFKAYYPIWAFLPGITLLIAFTLHNAMHFTATKAIAGAGLILIFSFLGDCIVLQIVLGLGIIEILAKTSYGIAVGTILESVIALIFLVICEVVKCRRTMKRAYFIN